MNYRNQTQFWQDKFESLEHGLVNELVIEQKSPLSFFFDELDFKDQSPFDFRKATINNESYRKIMIWYKLSYLENELQDMVYFVENQNIQFKKERQNIVLFNHYRKLSIICSKIQALLVSNKHSVLLELTKDDFLFFKKKNKDRIRIEKIKYYANFNQKIANINNALKYSSVQSIARDFFNSYELLFKGLSESHITKSLLITVKGDYINRLSTDLLSELHDDGNPEVLILRLSFFFRTGVRKGQKFKFKCKQNKIAEFVKCAAYNNIFNTFSIKALSHWIFNNFQYLKKGDNSYNDCNLGTIENLINSTKTDELFFGSNQDILMKTEYLPRKVEQDLKD